MTPERLQSEAERIAGGQTAMRNQIIVLAKEYAAAQRATERRLIVDRLKRDLADIALGARP